MPVVNDTNLAKLIRSGEISSLYFFYGKDIATIGAYAKKLSSKLVRKDDETYNLHKFNGKNLDISELDDLCESLPMFSDRMCIMINDLDFDNLNDKDYKYICEVFSRLQESTTVIVYITGINIYNKRNVLKTKNKKFITFCSKYGVVCEFDEKKPAELSKYIMSKVSSKGSSISKQNAEYIASLCLSNLMMINNEVDKLCDYAKTSEITKQIIDLLVSKQLDTNSFALAKAVAKFDAKNSMRLLDELYAQQTESIAILSAISMSFLDLYKARIAINEGVSQSQVVDDFYNKSRSFVVSNAFRDCRNISVQRLRQCIEILSDTDVDLKSSNIDGRLLIEKAIHSMLVN